MHHSPCGSLRFHGVHRERNDDGEFGAEARGFEPLVDVRTGAHHRRLLGALRRGDRGGPGQVAADDRGRLHRRRPVRRRPSAARPAVRAPRQPRRPEAAQEDPFSFPDSRDLLEVLRDFPGRERDPREDPLGSGRIP